MNIVSAIVIFSVTWFIALYCLLPIGIRSQEEAGEDVHEGAMAGAPANPNIKLKAIGATVIALLVTLIVWYLISNRILTLGVLDNLFEIEQQPG